METLKHIREMNNGTFQDLPIIALTANTISGAREMFRSEGFTEFIPKPIERAVLERVLRRVLPQNCIQYNKRPVVEDAIEEKEVASADLSDEKSVETVPAECLDPKIESVSTPSEPDISADAVSSSYAPLARVGVNVEKGLDYCGGLDDFYLEMLQMFASQYTEKSEELVSLYESANWKDYAIKVHALKSTSLTIGAEQLSAQARALELAGKNVDTEYIHQNHQALLRTYQEICESIAEL